MRHRLPIVVIVALVIVGCTDADSTELSTTSSTGSGGTAAPGGGDNGDNGDNGENGENGDPESPTTTVLGEAITEHRQVHAEDTGNGPVLHLVIPRGGFTDIDVESFIRDLKRSQPELWGVELFDNAEAQVAFMVAAADRTDDQRTLLSRHHLVTLTQGETLIWRGPFAALGQSTIGS